jgi:predicted phosphodiesterase
MRIAIFSDVHGNLPALEAFVQTTRESTDMYVCLGDVVNYGPWNDECLEMVLGLPGIVLLEGNHERLFLGNETVSNLLPLVQQFYDHSIQQFTRRDLISNLPLEYQLEGFVCRHTIADRRIYHNTDITVDRHYIIGHTHHAFDIKRDGYRIINCGSVGQNRGRLDYLSYAVMVRTSGASHLRNDSTRSIGCWPK